MKRIIYFDGVCNLCNTFVNMLIKLDRNKKFYFTPIQGTTAMNNNINFEELDVKEQSIIYSNENAQLFERSEAVLQILKDLFLFGFIFSFFKIIPLKLRDIAYKWIAKNRYRIFGHQSTCRVPTEEEKEMFLE